MERVFIALVAVAVAAAVAFALQRRRPAPPTNDGWNVPAQLDRRDFDRPEAPWLVAVFTSATCDTCAGVAAKAVALDGGVGSPVCVQEIEVSVEGELHRRYAIDAVPLVLLADHEGVVVWHSLGPVTATDLWAAVAEAREPGSTPQACTHDD